MDFDDNESHESSYMEDSSIEEFENNEMRIAQMKKGGMRNKNILNNLANTDSSGGLANRLKTKMNSLKSYDEIKKERALVRMLEGIRKILSLHTPVELSSLCGAFKLKVQQKASVSIELILSDLLVDGQVTEVGLERLFNKLWEGALWEYLRSIGHPTTTQFLDPKITVMRVWKDGGLLEGGRSFTPHFISREVKLRNEWVIGEDIIEKLDALRIVQEASKKAEGKVLGEHDYTNILNYFQTMSALRVKETELREYLIQEIDTARAKIDSCMSTNKMMNDQLIECETSFVRTAEVINNKLAITETLLESSLNQKVHLETDLQRCCRILQSYSDQMLDRNNSGAPNEKRPLNFTDLESSPLLINQLHEKMQSFHKLAITSDDNLRERSTNHVNEIDRLENVIRDLEDRLDKANEYARVYNEEKNTAQGVLKVALNKFLNLQSAAKIKRDSSWGTTMRYGSQLSSIQTNIKTITPALLSALSSTSKDVQSMSNSIIKFLGCSDMEEYNRIMECKKMLGTDIQSAMLQKFHAKKDAKKDKETKKKQDAQEKLNKAAAKEAAKEAAAAKKSGKKNDSRPNTAADKDKTRPTTANEKDNSRPTTPVKGKPSETSTSDSAKNKKTEKKDSSSIKKGKK
jgi:hypothetical protein